LDNLTFLLARIHYAFSILGGFVCCCFAFAKVGG